MKKYSIILVIVFSITSCATSQSVFKKENEVAGYTLKNKKELMQQKIIAAKKANKTVLATP